MRSVIRVSSGNFLEMYDFMVYAYYASYIAREIFPSNSEFASLMLTLGTFGAGYLMRPLGAVVLGAYVDRHGRRAGLIFTLFLMAVGTLVIACTPAYRTIGIVAPIVVVLGRLLQGFSAGVELAACRCIYRRSPLRAIGDFTARGNPPASRSPSCLPRCLGVILSSVMPPPTMSLGAGEFPFVIGCLIVPLLFWLRRSLAETEAFLARKHHPSISQILASLATSWKIVGVGMMLSTMTTVCFYLDHRVHSDLRPRGVAPDDSRKPDGHDVRRAVQFHLVAGRRRDLRQSRKAPDAHSGARSPTIVTSYPAMLWLVSSPSDSPPADC